MEKTFLILLTMAQCIRALTYKQVDLYIRYEIKTEKDYSYGE